MLCKLLLIGDSLIAGFGQRFPDSLNLGLPGNTTQGLARALAVPAQADCPGAPILIHIGINEITDDIARISARTAAIARTCVAQGHQVYILAIPSAGKWLDRVTALNTANSSLANSDPANLRIHFIPLPLTPLPLGLRTYLHTDAIHLEPSGYEVWMAHIQRYILQNR